MFERLMSVIKPKRQTEKFDPRNFLLGNISFLVVLIEAVEGITHQQAAGSSRTVMSVSQQRVQWTRSS